MEVYFICFFVLQAHVVSESDIAQIESPLIQLAARIRAGNIPNKELWVCKPEDRCDIDVDAFLFVDIKIAYQAIFYIQDKFHQVLDNLRYNWRSTIHTEMPMVETILRSYRRRVERYLRIIALPQFSLKNGAKLTYPKFFEFSKCAQDYLHNTSFTYIQYYTYHMENMTQNERKATDEAMSIIIKEETKRVAKFEKEMLCDVLFICEFAKGTGGGIPRKPSNIQSPEVVVNNSLIEGRPHIRDFVRDAVDVALELPGNKVHLFVELFCKRLMKSTFFTKFVNDRVVNKVYRHLLSPKSDADEKKSFIKPIRTGVANGYVKTDKRRYAVQDALDKSINMLDNIYDESSLILEHLNDKLKGYSNSWGDKIKSEHSLSDAVTAGFSYFEDHFYSFPKEFDEIANTKVEMDRTVSWSLPILDEYKHYNNYIES